MRSVASHVNLNDKKSWRLTSEKKYKLILTGKITKEGARNEIKKNNR